MPRSYAEFLSTFQLPQNELTFEMYNSLLQGKYVLYYHGTANTAAYYSKYDSMEQLNRIGMEIIFGDEDIDAQFDVFDPAFIFL